MPDKWRITLSDLQLDGSEIDAVRQVLESGWLSQGPVTSRFENLFARFVGAEHAIAVSSGTAALHLAYRAAGIGPGDEVLCPSMTFVATVNAILYCGAKPVFVDISDLTHPVSDLSEVERKITNRTRCLTIVDYGGYDFEIEALCELAHSAGLITIEDAAHAVGGGRGGRKFGTFADIGCFSFFSNKNMTTGEGGMVVTDDESYATRIRLLRSHGMTTGTWDRHRSGQGEYDVVDVGYNYRLDEIRSALGIAQLGKLRQQNKKRRVLVERYWSNLRALSGVELPFEGESKGSACHIMPILLPNSVSREQFVERMHNWGIQTSHHYPPVHLLSAYRTQRHESLPVTEEFGKREVTLPLHPLMTIDSVDDVCEHVADALEDTQ